MEDLGWNGDGIVRMSDAIYIGESLFFEWERERGREGERDRGSSKFVGANEVWIHRLRYLSSLSWIYVPYFSLFF